MRDSCDQWVELKKIQSDAATGCENQIDLSIEKFFFFFFFF